mgnify:CR=1 FL=1
MDSNKKKYTISLTEQELIVLANIMHHFTDYMSGDDRPDHGLAILKKYREMPLDEYKTSIYFLAGKLKKRARNK